MKRIFLISGKAQSGKDTTADFIKQALPNTLIIHNADYMKYMAKTYLGWNGVKDEEGRNILQQLGTDKVRVGTCKPMFWTWLVCEVIEILQNDFDYFCIPDTRFPNEIYLPKARFGDKVISIHIERPDHNNGLTEEQKKHPSETALDGFKFDYNLSVPSGISLLYAVTMNLLDEEGLTRLL
jgi:hypothetical protein